MTPASLKGKEFETLLLDAAKRLEACGTLTLGRYGVQGVTFGGKTILVPSLPDLEGCLRGGRQVVIEAKCCAGASFPLADDHFRKRQYAHLARRAAFGALCFITIHWAERRLASGIQCGMTVAVPVDASSQRPMPTRDLEANEPRRPKTNSRPIELTNHDPHRQVLWPQG